MSEEFLSFDDILKELQIDEEELKRMITAEEMKAKTQEMRALVVEAEAEIPKALAFAFREGRMGVMDYYNLRNIQADTEMRDSIAKPKTDAGKDHPNPSK